MKAPRRSILGLLLLGMLAEEPMHAYGLQKTLLRHGKDRVVNIRQRASVYQAIDRLLRAELIRVRDTERAERRPERTVYEITDQGRETVAVWLGEALRATEEFPEFVAAISVLAQLSPEQARTHLQARTELIRGRLADVEATLATAWADLTGSPGTATEPRLARLFLLEEEYRQAVLTAELTWLNGVVDDLRTGRLTWTHTELRAFAATFEENPDDDE
ncbi:PadR family transcriptional regulator [Amycolatopsis cynarae]|uniref:PadR family transcriptional regulator n=1 Tax=Amycolatopsis cynarae TaxID=2995223 RepID=A0ABY7BBJ8_9PSEU|nr:PadR family transcriptional regulator [Amycolatopsis sp. HUAS 11-8]WAL69350.1 PadR family transcriptional regulator [Amycolatopsis sp. HUAS 11-8]